jgi:hypothetical protein
MDVTAGHVDAWLLTWIPTQGWAIEVLLRSPSLIVRLMLTMPSKGSLDGTRTLMRQSLGNCGRVTWTEALH